MTSNPSDPSPSISPPGVSRKVDVVVIGAGQAGLSAAYHLQHLGLPPRRSFVVLDASPAPGGAWHFRWPTLTLSTVNRIHDLPGLPFSTLAKPTEIQVRASQAVPRYFATYEQIFQLPVLQPVRVAWALTRATA